MAHPNSHPYPLPFPNEVQRMQVASYSSLANALGTDPGYADQRGRTPRTTYDAVTDIQGIYLDEPPISTPLYPYPARNVLNPSTYLARTPLSVPSRSPSYTNVAWDHRDLTWRPSWYDRLPQPYFAEQDRPHGYQAGVEFPAIHFLRKGNKEPYSLSDLLAMDTMPDLVDGDSPILAQNPGRWIKIKLNWPGYSRFPFEKRIPIKRDVPWTPNLLLMVLAYHIEEFVRWIHNEGAVVEPGQEHWAIIGMTGDTPAIWKNCVITSLRHRTGSIWQPEIYYPRG